MSEDFNKYLGIANNDIQTANNIGELKSYVANILYDNDKKIDMIQELEKEIERLKIDYQQANEILAEQNKEIERLKQEYMILQNASDEVEEELQQRINEAIEYIKEKYDYILKDDTFLDHDERIDRKQVLSLLDILKGVDKE